MVKMLRKLIVTIFALTLGLDCLAFSEQSMQNSDLRQMDNSVRGIERAISVYLNGPEIRSVLTPGEFSQFPLKLKAGQVVFGEVRSDTFDPALEIVDSAGKSVAFNDDRYPGDQRPLLFWRCASDGAYSIHVRCFHDKLGGQFFARFKTYDTIDLTSDQKVERDVQRNTPILLRIPLKAGQIKEILFDTDGEKKYFGLTYNAWISPIGLPDLAFFTHGLQPAEYSIMAPVDGDYYEMMTPNGPDSSRGKVHVWTREVVPFKLTKVGNSYTARAPTKRSQIWELPVKKDELIEASTPDLDIRCNFRIIEVPDISKYDLSKEETNPFFPHPNKPPDEKGPAFVTISKRPRDNRMTVFHASRDAKLWLASDGEGPAGKQFTLRVKPAAEEFSEKKTNSGKLMIASTDFWVFDAKAGDVLTLNATSFDFSQLIIVRDPEMHEIRHFEAGMDQSSDTWRMIVQKPGRYVVDVSCRGNGGGGAYSLTRKVLHAKEFGLSKTASGEITDGQVQVWKFAATPDVPLLVHWNSSNWGYDVNIYDEKGGDANFQRDEVDAHNRYGILKVAKPQTYVLVLSGHREKASYSIELNPMPGYPKGAK